MTKDGMLLELRGGKDLSQFSLTDNTGADYQMTLLSDTEAFENGTILVGSEQVFFQKSLIGNNIQLDIKLLPYPVITSEGVDISSNTKFVTEIGGELFTLGLFQSGSLLQVVIKNSDDQFEFIGLLPEGASKSILLSDGTIITLEALDGQLKISR